MKKLLLVFIACLVCSIASAQYNYYKLSIGAGSGLAKAYGDLDKNYYRPATSLTLDYLFTPYLSLGVELQKGGMSGGDSVNLSVDPHLRSFKNSFSAFSVLGKVQLGQFVYFEKSNLLYHIKGFYVGTGFGMINNKMTEITRIKPDGSNYKFPGVDKGKDFFVPINTGIAFNFVDKWGFSRVVLDFNYQMSMTFGETLDGYNDPPNRFKNQHGDFYSVASVRIKINFGPEGLYY